jgi:uncharacterized DUF497 family protein
VIQVIWDLEDDEDGNYQHVQEHDVTPEEVEEILGDAASQTTRSRSTGRAITFGWTSAGRYLAVVWDPVEEDVIYPVTAYPAPEPGQRRGKA